MAYITRTNIDLVFGSDNVNKWANVNGNLDAEERTARINQSIADAQAWIDSRLSGGPYTVPFTEPVPTMIERMTAIMAGVMLYEARGIVDSEDSQDGENRLLKLKQTVMIFAQDYHARRVRLPELENFQDVPFAITPES